MGLILTPTLVIPQAISALGASYAQVLFSRSPVVGGILFVASFASPRLGIAGAIAALLAWRLAHRFGTPPGSRLEDGLYGFNPILLGWALAVTLPGAELWPVLLGAVAATFAVQRLLERLLPAGISALSLPYVGVYWALWMTAATWGAPLTLALPPVRLPLDAVESPLLEAFGALIFLPDVAVGIAVLSALAWVNLRFAAIFSLAAGLAFALAGGAGVAHTVLRDVVLFNALLGGLAMGLAFPLRGSLDALGATFGALGSGLLAYSLAGIGIPMLTLPFSIVTLGLLLFRRGLGRG